MVWFPDVTAFEMLRNPVGRAMVGPGVEWVGLQLAGVLDLSPDTLRQHRTVSALLSRITSNHSAAPRSRYYSNQCKELIFALKSLNLFGS